jgi:hypothetical protein
MDKFNLINRFHTPIFLLGSTSFGAKVERTCITLTRFSAAVRSTVLLAHPRKYSQLPRTKSFISAVLLASLFCLLAIILKQYEI